MEWWSQLHVTDVFPLGRGGHGQVFSARLTCGASIMQDVVVKLVLINQHDTEETELRQKYLEEEARLLAMMERHPNIIQLLYYDTANIEGVRQPYLLLEHGGVPLSAIMHRLGGCMEPGLAAFIAVEVLRGLAHAHEHGIIHRDIKPSNILIGWHGQVKLCDFGIAKSDARLHTLTKERSLKGTPVYLPPEAFRGEKLDGRADLWSVGILLFEMLTGKPPWEVSREQPEGPYIRQLSDKVFAAPVPELAGLPQEALALVAIVFRLLEKSPDDRFANALESIHALQNAIVGLIGPWAAARELGEQAYASQYPRTRSAVPVSNASTINVRPDKHDDGSLVSVIIPHSMASIVVPPGMFDEKYVESDVLGMDSSDLGIENSVVLSRPGDPEVTAQIAVPRRVRNPSVAAGVAASFAALTLALGMLWRDRAASSSGRELRREKPSIAATASLESSPKLRSPKAPGASTPPAELRESVAASMLAESDPQARLDALPDTAATVRRPEARIAQVAPSPPEPPAAEDAKIEPPATGSLEVVLLPRGAFVSIDGQRPVKAPVTLQKLRPGNHVLRLGLAEDALDRTERVRLKPGLNHVRVELANPFGAE